MRTCIVYSSATGNTKKIASGLSDALGFPLYRVEHPPRLEDYECFLLGFWVVRGMPDPKSKTFLGSLTGKSVFFFATHGAWTESDSIQKCKESVRTLLEDAGNHCLGCFTCQGKVHVTTNSHHQMTPERLFRLKEASRHPNEEDLSACLSAVKNAISEGSNFSAASDAASQRGRTD